MSQILRVGGDYVLKCEEWFWDGLNGKSALGYKKIANWLELAIFIGNGKYVRETLQDEFWLLNILLYLAWGYFVTQIE
jgi:hypothetical protein